jgi:hypothetical protein
VPCDSGPLSTRSAGKRRPRTREAVSGKFGLKYWGWAATTEPPDLATLYRFAATRSELSDGFTRDGGSSVLTRPSLPVVISRQRNPIGVASPGNPILVSFLKNRQFLFLAETIRPTGPYRRLRETKPTLPVIVGYGVNMVSGTGPVDTVPNALFQNLELLL